MKKSQNVNEPSVVERKPFEPLKSSITAVDKSGYNPFD
jgi:hypothetical protein